MGFRGGIETLIRRDFFRGWSRVKYTKKHLNRRQIFLKRKDFYVRSRTLFIVRDCGNKSFYHFIILLGFSVFGFAVNIADVSLAAINT